VALGESVYPLYEAALATEIPFVIAALFVGTVLACLASASGCIADSGRSWFSMARDTLIPAWFGGVHPKYKTPYRAIVFLVPISLSFAFTGLLDQVIAFSILSGIYIYLLVGIMMLKFRQMYPLGNLNRGYIAPWHPYPAVFLIILTLMVFVGFYLGYAVNLLAGTVFYILASIWFVVHRYKFVDTHTFLKSKWPRPQGY
ncbi:MAG: APC family permease, partial [Clostridia bacterium]|nr:APC family permease [Clostridia bacterium]